MQQVIVAVPLGNAVSESTLIRVGRLIFRHSYRQGELYAGLTGLGTRLTGNGWSRTESIISHFALGFWLRPIG